MKDPAIAPCSINHHEAMLRFEGRGGNDGAQASGTRRDVLRRVPEF